MSLMKFKKNPESIGNCCVDGVIFDDSTVVAGNRWNKWTIPMFPGKPPILIRAMDDAVENKWHKDDSNKVKDVQPGSARSVISTVPIADRLRADNDAREKKAMAEEAAKKAADNDDRGIIVVPKQEFKVSSNKPAIASVAPVSHPDSHVVEENAKSSAGSVMTIPGINEARAKYLVDGGYDSVEKIATSDPNEMLSTLKRNGAKINIATVRQVIRAAKSMS